MPKLGLTMTEGKIVKWLRGDGERVEKGQPLVVVMTKKITSEIEAPASGILRIAAQPRETLPVGSVMGFILAPGEAMPDIKAVPSAIAAAVTAEEARPLPAPVAAVPSAPPEGLPPEVRASPAARRLARELGLDIRRLRGSGQDGRISEEDVRRSHEEQARVQATPLARRMAEEEGLDLTQIQGTGPAGRITEDDVLRALEGREAPIAVPSRVIPFTGIRQAIAETMMESLHSTAQLTLTARADVRELVELREALSQRWGERISYTDLIVKAAALALRQHPILNSTLAGEEIVLHEEVHIGVAVAVDEGLIVPVVRQADRKTVREIHQARQNLTQRARTGQLTVDEVTGSTFTITNLGMYGVEAFTPIINPPEVAILGVGRISEELALANGQVVPRARMVLSLTIDHRIVDGAPGAAFLQTLVRLLEQPERILSAEGV